MRQMEELITISQTLEFDKLKVGFAQSTQFIASVGGGTNTTSSGPDGASRFTVTANIKTRT